MLSDRKSDFIVHKTNVFVFYRAIKILLIWATRARWLGRADWRPTRNAIACSPLRVARLASPVLL